jgi:type IX secretion system PorP/SprF family membrane protein
MKRSRKLLTFILLLGVAYPVVAQDPMYTHAFMSPVYLNPAATGMSDYDFRVSAIHRRQWFLVPSGLQYTTLSADKYIAEHGVGAGLLFNSAREGYIRSVSGYGTLSKLVCFGSHQLSLGLQAGFFNRRVDYGNLWFSDQINNEGIILGAPSQVTPAINNGRWRFDYAAGFMWQHYNGLMLGGAVHHINQPDESFTNAQESVLPRRLTVTSRWPILLGEDMLFDDDVYVVPGLIYSKQRKNETLSLGAEIKTHYVNLGLWYRFNMDVRRSDAFCITFTFDNFLGRGYESDGSNRLRLGGSFDATTNGAGFTRTAGSTEGALVWEHLFNEDATSDNRCNSRARNPVPCPKNLYMRVL